MIQLRYDAGTLVLTDTIEQTLDDLGRTHKQLVHAEKMAAATSPSSRRRVGVCAMVRVSASNWLASMGSTSRVAGSPQYGHWKEASKEEVDRLTWEF